MIKLKFIILVLVLIAFSGDLFYVCSENKAIHNIEPKIVNCVLDTIYSLDYVYSIAGKKTNPAKFILDSLERREKRSGYKNIPFHKILIARSFVASREFCPNLALYYALKAFNLKEVQNNPKDYGRVVDLISNEYYVLNRMDESVKYSLLSMEYSKRNGDYCGYAISKLNFWVTHLDLSNTSKAIKEIRDARELLIKYSERVDSTDIIWSYEVEGSVWIHLEKYETAISLYEKILSIYINMTQQDRVGTEVESQQDLDFKKGQTHITLATLNAYAGKMDIAKRHYNEWEKLHKNLPIVRSGELYHTVLEYLKKANMYKEALEYSLKYQDSMLDGDSINMFSLDVKRQMGSIYYSLKDYKNALFYEHQASAIADSLYNRSNYCAAIEMATIYETTEKESKILIQEEIIARNRMFILTVVIFAISVIIIAIIVWINSKKISRKNIALFNQIQMLRNAKKGIGDAINSVSKIDNNGNIKEENILFSKLEECMNVKKLFLNPDINRELVAMELGTNYQYLSNAIRENIDMTFGEYVNQLKLEYAQNLLLDDSDMKIEAISVTSGFNSVRTFYRLFQKKYNLTPSEFRNIALRNKK